MSYGCFKEYMDLGTLYVNPLVYTGGITSAFDPNAITEEIDYSWYSDRQSPYKPIDTVPDDDMSKYCRRSRRGFSGRNT